jgi:hypothetical protein
MNPYDFTADIKGPTARFPVGSRSPDTLDSLTEEEMVRLNNCLPSEWDVMVGWATPVIAASPAERRVLIAAQMEVLDGLYDDPQKWCRHALELAEVSRGR